MTLFHHDYDGKEELRCMCGCKGKKKPHVRSDKAVFCGSCGRMLVNHHGQVM
jgi:hypothetical protein